MGVMRRDLECRLRAVEVAGSGGIEIWIHQSDGTVRGPRGEQMTREEGAHLEAATELARAHGIAFAASGGASEPGTSLKRHDQGSPWTLCRRPWTVMYFTANGRALPCCIAPFSQRGYENYTLGDATQESLREIWNGAAYRSFRDALLSDKPPASCANCGLRWSL